jgi:acyl-CoA oxidase
VDDVNPFYAHTKLFTNTIREQASDEQLAYWMPKIESWEVTGGYAQVTRHPDPHAFPSLSVLM